MDKNHPDDPIALAFLELRPDVEPDHGAYLDLAYQGDCLATLDAYELELELETPGGSYGRRRRS